MTIQKKAWYPSKQAIFNLNSIFDHKLKTPIYWKKALADKLPVSDGSMRGAGDWLHQDLGTYLESPAGEILKKFGSHQPAANQ